MSSDARHLNKKQETGASSLALAFTYRYHSITSSSGCSLFQRCAAWCRRNNIWYVTLEALPFRRHNTNKLMWRIPGTCISGCECSQEKYNVQSVHPQHGVIWGGGSGIVMGHDTIISDGHTDQTNFYKLVLLYLATKNRHLVTLVAVRTPGALHALAQ